MSLFENGFQCSQGILCAFGDRFGLDEDTAHRIADGFGGGMARMGNVCGALTGAFMVIGLRHGMTDSEDDEAHEKTVDLINEFVERFKDRKGTILCKELIGYEIDAPEKRAVAKEAGVFQDICPKLVRDAGEILEELLNE